LTSFWRKGEEKRVVNVRQRSEKGEDEKVKEEDNGRARNLRGTVRYRSTPESVLVFPFGWNSGRFGSPDLYSGPELPESRQKPF